MAAHRHTMALALTIGMLVSACGTPVERTDESTRQQYLQVARIAAVQAKSRHSGQRLAGAGRRHLWAASAG